MSLATYALAFLFYLVQYFVIFFFNSALVGAATILTFARPYSAALASGRAT